MTAAAANPALAEKPLPLAAQTAITGCMPRYISHHTVACQTRQALQALLEKLKQDGTVKCIRFVSDSLEGKLLCEFEAPDKDTVLAVLKSHRMEPQWVMRIEQEW